MAQLFKNNAFSTLSLPLTSSATSMTLVSAAGFDSPVGADYFLATLIGIGANGMENAWEIVKVTSRASNTLTIARAQEGTTAVAWPAATQVQVRLTAGSMATKANVSSPEFTGTPTAPTAAAGTSTTQIASTAFVRAEVASLTGAAPAGLDTLDELAAAIGDDPNFAATMTSLIAAKAPSANPTFTGTVSGVTKAHVGLGSADNTSDANKPVSTAQQTALNAKANLASPALTGTPTAPTATAGANTTQIATTAFVRAEVAALVASSPAALDTLDELAAALGDDPNFATTMTNALAAKAPLASPTFSGTVGGITKAMVGLASVDNTSDAGKPVSTAQQAALDVKAPIANPTFTGTVGGVTKAMVGLGNVDNTADSAKPVSTAQAAAIDSATTTLGLNAQTGTAYTLVLSDAGKRVSMSNSAANVVTVPLNSTVSYPVGTMIFISQDGTGATSIAAAGGVTINTSLGLKIGTRYMMVSLIKTGADIWLAVGTVA